MATSKVTINGVTEIDLTADTVTADTLAEGVTAHNAAGEVVTGTMTAGSTENSFTVYGGGTISSTSGLSRAVGTTEIISADSIVVETSSSSYQALQMMITKFQIGAEINAKATRSYNGKYWLVRFRFLDASGSMVDGTEHKDGGTYSEGTMSGTLSCTIPEGTKTIELTLASNWSTSIESGTEVTFSDIRVWYSPETLSATDVVYNTTYTGEELHLVDGSMSSEKHGCNISRVASFNTTDNTDIDTYYFAYSQGLAIYGGYIFNLCESNGTLNDIQVINLSTMQVVSATTLSSPGYPNHQNTGFFSDIFYDSADEFPLLFVSRCGNSAYQSGESLPYDQCEIFRVTRSDTVFTFTVVNTITITGTHSYGTNFSFDKQQRLLYASCPTVGNWQVSTSNPVKHWVFCMPSTADILSGTAISIDISTALASMTSDYYTVQGSVVDGGVLYEGVTTSNNQYIYAWDIFKGKLLAKIPAPLYNVEMQGLATCNGKIYFVQRTATYLNLYTLSFD